MFDNYKDSVFSINVSNCNQQAFERHIIRM